MIVALIAVSWTNHLLTWPNKGPRSYEYRPWRPMRADSNLCPSVQSNSFGVAKIGISLNIIGSHFYSAAKFHLLVICSNLIRLVSSWVWTTQAAVPFKVDSYIANPLKPYTPNPHIVQYSREQFFVIFYVILSISVGDIQRSKLNKRILANTFVNIQWVRMWM